MTDVRTKNETEKYTRYGKRNKKKEEKEEGEEKKKRQEKLAKKKGIRASEEIQTHTGRLRRATTTETINN